MLSHVTETRLKHSFLKLSRPRQDASFPRLRRLQDSVGRYHRLCTTVSTVEKILRYSVVSWRYFRYYLNQ